MKNQSTYRLTPVTDAAEIIKTLGLGPNASLKFHCHRCSLDTAGVYESGVEGVRTCPSCHATLIFCPICRTAVSTEERYKVLVCDKCGTNFVTETTTRYLAAREHESAEIVLSGVRATGSMHVGNYFGAINQFVTFQDGQNFCMYFVADWHTLTTCHDPRAVAFNTVGIATDYIAAGLDPEKSLIYAQSNVPEIVELALLLSMFADKKRVERLPTIKDLVKPKRVGKSWTKPEPLTMGILFYPILMAADILGPKATLIPVGRDQSPNVEFAAELAEDFNKLFGPVFPSPRRSLNPVVPSLSGGKMAKSESDTCIMMMDNEAVILSKYQRFGVTDTGKTTRGAKGDPEKCVSVFPMYKILHGEQGQLTQEISSGCRSGQLGCADCKKCLAKELADRIAPFQERRQKLRQDFVADVLHFGGLKAREIFGPTLEEVRSKLGLVPA